jgi:hypothetical protein
MLAIVLAPLLDALQKLSSSRIQSELVLCGFSLLREPFVLVLTLENSKDLGSTWMCTKSNDNQLIN